MSYFIMTDQLLTFPGKMLCFTENKNAKYNYDRGYTSIHMAARTMCLQAV
jgi:hypothetical protein